MPPQIRSSQSSKAKATTQAVEEDLVNPPKDASGLFENWQSSSTKLALGGKLSEQEAQWNIKENNFGQTVEVYQKECFTLKPLTITEGPYKGRNVLMLMPIEPCKQFRFLALPAELRVMVYKILLLEKQPITLDTIKVTHIPRRPVREGFRGTGTKHASRQGLKWDRFTGKYIGQTPSNFALLRVNKQVSNEAAAVAYSNRLSMDDPQIATTFLKRIGNMGQYLKHIDLDWVKIGSTLKLIRDGMNLRAITFSHDSICDTRDGEITITGMFVHQCTQFLRRVHKARKDRVVAVAALELFQFKTRESCDPCRNFCKTTCASFAEHHAVVVAKFRALMAKALGISEGG
ncbi:hypothetical protein LTR17_017371 [Elasticomyces elasticus]|nr:hypothetical protein LTR17_017371 [Elasticomyces elasticus]